MHEGVTFASTPAHGDSGVSDTVERSVHGVAGRREAGPLWRIQDYQ